MDVDVEGERGVAVALADPLRTSRMSAVPASPSRPDSCSSARATLPAGRPLVLEQPQHETGVDAARARRHDQALERREAHGRVDRAPAVDRAERGAGAEMAAHDPQLARRACRAARRRGARRRRGRGRGTRSGAAASAHARRRGARRSRRPPGSVAWNAVSKQATDGTPGRARATTARGLERGRLVQRGEVGERVQVREHLGVDAHGLAVPLAAVHDPVADRVGRSEAGQRRRERAPDPPSRPPPGGRARSSAHRRRRAAAA